MNRARVILGIFLVAVLAVSLTSETYLAGKLAYYYDVLITIGINVILAVSLNLVNGYTGQFSLGHAGFMAVGAYAAGSWSNHLDPLIEGVLGGAGNPLATNAALVVSMLFGGLLAALAGLLVGIPSLRLREDYLAIVTLGFGEIIRTAILNTDFLGAARGLSVSGNYTNLFWTYGLAGICVYTVLALVNSTYGRGFLTVRDDEVAAEAMGINTTRYKVQAFVVASFFAGIAGALYGHFKAFLTPEGFNFFRSVDVVVMVILGGMGSTLGVILAAFLLTVLPEGLRALAHTTFMPPHLQGLLENRLIVYSLLLIVLMLTRPQGLFGDPSAVKRRLTRPKP
ncbi:MAG TPA: branched-chain amino acid ABC transporter permease [Chthoniobacterales bacterium]